MSLPCSITPIRHLRGTHLHGSSLHCNLDNPTNVPPINSANTSVTSERRQPSLHIGGGLSHGLSRFHYQQPGCDQYQRGWGAIQDGSSIAPIPAKLTKKIRALEFVEMRELLPDNIAMAERLAALPSSVTHAKPPSEREIGGDKALITWVASFCTYVAIVAEAHPERVVDMLAYMRLLIREAGKFGGTGWLTYDSVFRRNNEGKHARWNYLDASLHQVYIATPGEKPLAPCRYCQEIDHSLCCRCLGS